MAIMLEHEQAVSSRSEAPRRYLFAHWDGGGNTPPTLSIIRRLVARGHHVHVVSDPCARDEFERAGASFAEWRRAPRRADRTAAGDPLKDWEVSAPPAVLARMRDRVMVGPALAYAQDLWDEHQRFDADVFCVNDLLLGAMIAGERAARPTATLAPNICMVPLPGVPAFGPGFMPARHALHRLRDRVVNGVTRFLFGRGTPAFNEARAAMGLAPLSHPFDQFERVDRHLVLTSRHFDFVSTALPDRVVYTGPELADPGWTGTWTPPWPDDDDRPLVLVGFSSTFMNQGEVLARVIDALAPLAARVLVTTGPGLGDVRLPSPPNVHVVEGAPHSAVLPHASLVVTHAGHGTVIRALAAGVPLLCMPMGRDQNDNAARVVHRGVGRRLAPTAGVAAIRSEVAALLADEEVHARARALGRQLRADADASPLVSILEDLAAQGAQR